MHFSKRGSQLVIFFVISLFVTSCMVGPNFHSPAAPHIDHYTPHPLPKQTVSTSSIGNSGKSQRFISKKDIPVEWWALFHSPQLNHLITIGLENSPNLAAAYASLRQAQETLNAQIGNSLFPAFNIGSFAQRQRFPDSSIGQTTSSTVFNLFNISANVSYTLDTFGGLRRQIEALDAQVNFQQFELVGVYLTLTSNIVTTAITLASFQEQIKATRELIKAQEDQLKIIKQQFELGGVSKENVLTQETLVAQTRATLPPLEKSAAQSYHALAVLIGAYPNTQLPKISLKQLNLPRELPLTLPSELVRQRPDVRASEALLHAASAQIGVATANLLPQITLSGNFGWEGNVLSSLLEPQNKSWGMLAQFVQPVFHGGALLAQRRAAIAAYQKAAAQYRQTVLQAFKNVADTLRALELDAKLLRAQRLAELSAHNSLILSKNQFQLGGVSYLTLLNAQEQYLQARISRIQAQAARYNDTAALFQALGGGWWKRKWCADDESFKKCYP